MKIVQMVDVFHPVTGGISSDIKMWAENMPEYDFEVVTNAFRNQKLTEMYSDNVTIRRFLPNDMMLDTASKRYSLYTGKFEFLFFPYRIASEMARFRRKCEYLKGADYDILHFNGPVTNYELFTFDRHVGRVCLTRLTDFSFVDRPKVLTLHGLVSRLTRNKVDVENEKRLIKTFDNILCVSDFVYSWVESYLRDVGEEKNVWYIPNSVNMSKFKPVSQEEKLQCKADLGYENKIIAAYVGRLDKEKGLDILIKSWADVVSKHPNAHLLLVGGGHETKYLAKYAEGLKISKNVEFVGEVEEVYQFLKISDLFVLPTFWEGLSVALLEAMSCGLPVVSTNVTGTPDVVKDAGLLVEPGDHSLLGDAINRLIGDENLREKMGKAGRRIVEEKYNDKVVVKRIKEVYASLI